MKKCITILLLLILVRSNSVGQISWKDTIMHQMSIATDDTTRALLLAELGNYYKFLKPDSGLHYAYRALVFARQIKFPKAQLDAMTTIGITEIALGNDAKALQINLQATKIAEENNLMYWKIPLLQQLGMIYNRSKNFPKALNSTRESMKLADSSGDIGFYTNALNLIANTFLDMNLLDSALYYSQRSYDQPTNGNIVWARHAVLLTLGKIQKKRGNTDLALSYFKQSLPIGFEVDKIIESNLAIAQFYYEQHRVDSSIYYAEKSFELARKSGFYLFAFDASDLLSKIHEPRDLKKALHYKDTSIAYQDSLYNHERETALENFILFDAQERQYEIDTAKTTYQNQIKQYALLAGLGLIILIAIVLFHNNRQKQKANKVLETTLSDLKSTQTQLIQSEKMASLGELTAGIAHEIQNPLNFVNNFSEVNKELLSELGEELGKENYQAAKSIAKDVAANQEKINHHGRRADAIVKGMLQHSRSSSGVKELTDINALADEYLRLAYHGLRAKDKSFNASLKTDFDKSIGNINVVPQDIGRVILNLISNAFYAVTEKKKVSDVAYEPSVFVSTKSINGSVMITIKDNGNGIAPKVLDKIFQPFFTTKPTGQGTGLGLSLSYDVIKAHGGTLAVETKEGEGSEFRIELQQS